MACRHCGTSFLDMAGTASRSCGLRPVDRAYHLKMHDSCRLYVKAPSKQQSGNLLRQLLHYHSRSSIQGSTAHLLYLSPVLHPIVGHFDVQYHFREPTWTAPMSLLLRSLVFAARVRKLEKTMHNM